MKRDDVKVGDYITHHGPYGNVWTARVAYLNEFRLSYESSDGVVEGLEDTCFKDYDLNSYEPATPDAIAAWNTARAATGYYANSWD